MNSNINLPEPIDIREAMLRDYPPPPLFSVVSWGCAATAWLARTLNAHRDIFCVHAGNSTWGEWTGGTFGNAMEYMLAVGVLGTGNKAAGDVHGVHHHEIAQLREELPDLRCAVVVREPVARLRSALALWQKFNWQCPEDATLDAVIDRAGLNPAGLTKPERVQVQFAHRLNAIVEEREVARVFRCEDLTSSPAALEELIDEITGGTVATPREWAEWAVAQPRSNRHLPTYQPMNIDLGELVRRFVTPEAQDAYRQLGYTLP